MQGNTPSQRNRREHCVSQWLVLLSTLAAPTISDCFSADKLAFLKDTCALITGFTCPATASKRLNNMLNLVIPDFLSWLTLETVDEVVHNPSSSKYFNRLQVCPQVSVFPSPGFLHTNRMHVLPVAPKVYQPFSLGPLACWKQRDEPASRTVGNLLHQTLESLRSVHQRTAVDHSW